MILLLYKKKYLNKFTKISIYDIIDGDYFYSEVGMNWTEVCVTTNSEGIEAITGILLNIGITGMRIENADDFNEFLEGTQTYWDYVDEELMYLKDCETKVFFYLPDNTQGIDMFASVKQEIEMLKAENKYGDLEIKVTNVKEEDWANNWKQFFKPFNIGDKFLIKPTWETVENKDNRKILEIDPGMSYGTGTHETTALCLEVMEKLDLKDKEVLDLGCGSGILSIGALLMEAKHLNLVDIDQNSVKIAGENIMGNDFDKKVFDAHCGNIIDDEALREKIGYKKYDVIFANIVADVLKAMSPYFNEFLKENSTLVVSGIISERKDEVVDTIKEKGFTVLEEYERGAWACVVLKN